MTTTTAAYRIALDAAYDLLQGGYDPADADRYAAAFRAAAQQVAEWRGIAIAVVPVGDEYAGTETAACSQSEEADRLWQEIHERVYRTPQGRWETTVLRIAAMGGTEFEVSLSDKWLGRMTFGDVDDDGQYVGDEDDIIAEARRRFGVAASVPARVDI